MPRGLNSDNIQLVRDLRRRLAEQTDPPNASGCWLYHPLPSEPHIRALIYGRPGWHIVSVRRVAWAFAHELEVGRDENGRLRGCLLPNEEVITLCGTVGAEDTADGQCVNPEHLGRGSDHTRCQFHSARHKIAKQEVTR